jgi:hypothetical protein
MVLRVRSSELVLPMLSWNVLSGFVYEQLQALGRGQWGTVFQATVCLSLQHCLDVGGVVLTSCRYIASRSKRRTAVAASC